MSGDTRRETPKLTTGIAMRIWRRINELMKEYAPCFISSAVIDQQEGTIILRAGWMTEGEAPTHEFYTGVVNWRDSALLSQDVDFLVRMIAASQAVRISEALDWFLTGDDVPDIGTLPSDSGGDINSSDYINVHNNYAVRWSPSDEPAIDETPTVELSTDDTQPIWWDLQLDSGHGDMDEHAPEAFEMFVRALRMGGLGR